MRARERLRERYREFYLGGYGSQESLEKYQKLLGEHIDSESPPELETTPNVPGADSEQWTVAELAMKYDEFASKFYQKNGKTTDDRYRAAIAPLVSMYGETLAVTFGPKKLKALREYEPIPLPPTQIEADLISSNANRPCVERTLRVVRINGIENCERRLL